MWEKEQRKAEGDKVKGRDLKKSESVHRERWNQMGQTDMWNIPQNKKTVQFHFSPYRFQIENENGTNM